MSLLRGVEGGVGESHGRGGRVGVHSDRVLCRGLGMISVLVDTERVLGVEGLPALVAGPGDVDVKLHVAPHVAQVIRLSAADSAAPHQLVGLLLAILENEAADLFIKVHGGGVAGHRSELPEVGGSVVERDDVVGPGLSLGGEINMLRVLPAQLLPLDGEILVVWQNAQLVCRGLELDLGGGHHHGRLGAGLRTSGWPT